MKNFSLTKFDAIDGTKLDQNNIPLSELAKAELQQLKTTGFRTKHYQLTMGAIGCYLSHVKVWEHILKHDNDVVLVLEDDAKLPENFLSEVNENVKYIPNDWDIILLGYLCKKCYEFQKYKEVERFQLTHAYLIKKTAIVKMMNSNTLFPITQQIDALMSELSSIINIYSLKKKIVPQFQSRTDIQAPIIDKDLREKLNININDRIKVL
jgi:GR25 family glycosyltransferase involved in LPS biosynthesis